MTKSSGKGSGAKGEQQGFSWGCFTVIAVLVAAGVLWGMYDDGVFDKKASDSAPMFGPSQVGRLVEQLSKAADAQGVCYGWVIDSGRNRTIDTVTPSYPGTFSPHPPRSAVNQVSPSPTARPRPGGTPSASPTARPTPTLDQDARDRIERELRMLDRAGIEYGSNLGPGRDPREAPEQCPKWVVLEAEFGYSSVEDEYVYGTLDIESSFGGRLRVSDYETRLGQRPGNELVDEYGTDRLRDAIAGLPMLVADEGLAPPVPAETSPPAPPPANDRLAQPAVTARRVWTVVGSVLLGCAVVVLIVGAVKTRGRSGS